MQLYESIKPLKESTYLHISNGGVTVGMEYDSLGENCLKINAGHFGIKTNEMKIPITKSALRAIILDLVYELENWREAPRDSVILADAKKDMIFGDLAKAVASIIGYPDVPEEMSGESFTPDKSANREKNA